MKDMIEKAGMVLPTYTSKKVKPPDGGSYNLPLIGQYPHMSNNGNLEYNSRLDRVSNNVYVQNQYPKSI